MQVIQLNLPDTVGDGHGSLKTGISVPDVGLHDIVPLGIGIIRYNFKIPANHIFYAFLEASAEGLAVFGLHKHDSRYSSDYYELSGQNGIVASNQSRIHRTVAH